MKPTRLLLLTIAAATTLIACESTPHYNRSKIVSLTTETYPKKPYGTVKLFETKEAITNGYDVIALLSVEGKPGEEAAFIKAFLYRAADVGADAIILHRGDIVAGTEGGLSISGRSGGFTMPVNPSQDAVYRAEAIRFK